MTWYTANGDIQADTSSNLSNGNNGVDISAEPGALGGEHNAFNNVERTSGGLGSALGAGGGSTHIRQPQGTHAIAALNVSGMQALS
ncbi:hypothetical protein GS634_03095 [Ruegeria atlantica]|uniref:Uncharacterized protein n=1 Tax=Ruegeria atlantica TaxID=81569 RepID=A0AA90YS42_9RHOB|nr:hypothetical protein [Ruegeria atlantica]NOE17105.1 hypothetical protein [Ruegeria atlantica]